MMFYTQLGTDKVTAKQLEEMTTAINHQMKDHFCPAYRLSPIPWSVLSKGASAHHGDIVVTLMDNDKSVPDTLGYHSEQYSGVKFGSILVEPCLKDIAGNPLVSVAQCLSHECCEAAGDLACDVWVLAVLPHQVVDTTGGCATNGGVVSVMVVEMQPGVKSPGPGRL